MNRILSAYLARVATAAEHAPFGVAGVWQVNRFFNSSLVWAAKSVIDNKDRFETEQTAEAQERLAKAKVRFHTVLGLYRTYVGAEATDDGIAAGVACPKLELPHVQQYLGLDRIIPKEKIVEQAKAAAGTALMAAITGGYVSGDPKARKAYYAAAYTKKTKAMDEATAKNLRQLDAVFGQCWEDFDATLYDEGEIENFISRMRSMLMLTARANWLANKTKQVDDDMAMLDPEKYEKAKSWMLGCENFLNEFGVTTGALEAWEVKINGAVKAVADEYSGDTDKLMAEIDGIEAEVMQDVAEAEAKEAMPVRALNHLNKDGSIKATYKAHEAGQAAAARKAEDKTLAQPALTAKAEHDAEVFKQHQKNERELAAKIKKAAQAKERRRAAKHLTSKPSTAMENALALAVAPASGTAH